MEIEDSRHRGRLVRPESKVQGRNLSVDTFSFSGTLRPDLCPPSRTETAVRNLLEIDISLPQ